MFGGSNGGKADRIGFILLPDFSMMGFASAVEPLRLANRVSESNVYECTSYSIDGGPVLASNGMLVNVDAAVADLQGVKTVYVCGGLDVHKRVEPVIIKQLRRCASHGSNIGGICTGSYVLAKAGLLDGYRCTIHWENTGAMVEEFPEVEVTSDLFEIDRNRWTCAGGTAPIDMMLFVIADELGHAVAASVADELIYHRIREGDERQRMELRARLGVSHPKLLSVVEHMEQTLEEPLNCAQLAETVGLSTRQLERLFRKYMGVAPTRYYLELRLKRARFLLHQTSLPILSVALACGFVSASHFSKCYREYFARTPSQERRGA